jgi:pimeloyl-ACP methyl ester carboxylesterase
METVNAGGHRIAYERHGEGPPLVLLHGYVGDQRMFIPGAGHVCNIDAAERFNSEVRAFLRG